MEIAKKESQYSLVAKKAYENIVLKKMPFKDAWISAAAEKIKSISSQEKPCPWHAFLGFCESGDLKGIQTTQKSGHINYQYARFAINEWNKDDNISAGEMWKRVRAHFKRAENHQGQLHVARGLRNFLV